MLRRISLPYLFVLAAIVTMVLAAGGVWQFARPVDDMLRALVPTWVGIACVFWVLWRRLPPPADGTAAGRAHARRPAIDVDSLRLETRYTDISRLPLTALDYVAVDTETTGPHGTGEAIVQIGAVRIADGEVCEEAPFTQLVNPGRPIPPESTRFHGVTDEMVADAPALGTVLAAFKEFAGNSVIVGHNLAADLDLIGRKDGIENPVLDTMLLSIGTFEGRCDHTLDALAAHFGEPVENRHSAPDDADLTARIFLRLVPELDRVGARCFGDAQDLCAHAAEKINGSAP